MVMETPSPQCVGREFVRQYYTLLNKAPLQLHRFYSDNSSFVHGGLDRPGEETKPVVGQQQIHCKIVQLNFQDCHAKIRQVDSHETLGNGVVIQVTGELSNNGQPMRRFMQTFVLALQSPLKYYVRNDIFRYQDEVFNDDEEMDNRESVAETNDAEVDKVDPPAETHDALGSNAESTYYDQEVMGNGSLHSNGTHSVSMTVAPSSPCPPSPPVGTTAPATNNSIDYHPELEIEHEQEKSGWEENVEYSAVEDKNETQDTDTLEETSTVQSEQKTYAKMVSKPPSSFGQSGVSAVAFPSASVSSKCEAPGFVKSDQGSSPSNSTIQNVTNNNTPLSVNANQTNYFSKQSQPQRTGRLPRLPSRGSIRDESKESSTVPFSGKVDDNQNVDSDNRRKLIGSQYPDSQQLFVGNLHRCINEEELKDFFMAFGNVLDMKIYSKPNQKVPNYGFIVFDNTDAVQKALSEKSLNFKGHRLNVEEKKTKPRDPRMGDNRMSPGRGGMMGRGGPSGGGRGMRGGGGLNNMQGSGRGETRVRGGSYVPRRV